MTRNVTWTFVVLLPLLAGCDQRVLGEFGYNGSEYRASYEAIITLQWKEHTVTSRRYVDELEQTLPPSKGYISYSYNPYVTLDADTVVELSIGHNGAVNSISIERLFQRGTDQSGKVVCKQFSRDELPFMQFSPSIMTTTLKTRPASDGLKSSHIKLPPDEASCNDMILAGQSKTEISGRP